MATPLDNLVVARQLKAEPSSVAYDAAFTLVTASLRSAGYRADAARGHRAVVFQALPHTLNAPQDLWTALSTAHDRRNAVEYSSALAPTESEARDLLSLARKLDDMVRARINKLK